MRANGFTGMFFLLAAMALGMPAGLMTGKSLASIESPPAAVVATPDTKTKTLPALESADSLTPALERLFFAEGLLKDQALSLVRGRCTLSPVHLDFSLALVPDPAFTRLDLTFDQRMLAIQEAFATDGWRAVQYWLPWSAKRSGAAKDLIGRAGPGLDSAFPNPGTGLLLFRTRAAPNPGGLIPRYHLVFLVGESPTLGINRASFRAAGELGLQLKLACPAPKTSPAGAPLTAQVGTTVLKLIGPSFSGSAQSLGEALTQLWDRSPPPFDSIRIESPSVSDPKFKQHLGLKPPLSEQLRYATHILNSEQIQAMVYSQFGPSARIAWFTESRTGFGATVEEQASAQAQKDKPYIRPYRYPIGIAQVRQEQNQRAQQSAQNEQALPSQQHRLLSIYLSEAGMPEDSIQPLSLYTARRVELFLADRLNGLKRQGYTHLGITGTNVHDVVFIAGLAHSYLPDAIVFTTSSNELLFAHPDNARSTDGMLMFGAYPISEPMLLAAHRAAVAESTDLFSSEEEYGTFFATLAVLRNSAEGEIQYQESYVSYIDHGSAWPISVDVAGELASDKRKPGADPERLLLALLAMILALIGTGYVLTQAGWLPGRNRPPAALNDPAEAAATAIYRRLDRLCTGAALLVCLGIMALLAFGLWSALLSSPLKPAMVRFVSLSPGVSLAYPAALLAFASLVIIHYQRQLARRLTVVADFRHLGCGVANLEKPIANLAACMRHSYELRTPDAITLAMLALGLGLGGGACVLIRPLADPRWVGIGFAALCSLLLTWALFSFLRFQSSWRALRRLLENVTMEAREEHFRGIIPESTSPLQALAIDYHHYYLTRLVLDELKGESPDATLSELSKRLENLNNDGYGEYGLGRFAKEWQLRLAVDRACENTLAQQLAEGKASRLQALLTTRLMSRIFIAFRCQLYISMTGLLSVLLALSAFPFQPRALFATVVWVSTLLVSGLLMTAAFQMSRNKLLSALSGGTAGKINFDSGLLKFLFKYVVLPLLLVAATQVPALSNLIHDYLNPLMQLVH